MYREELLAAEGYMKNNSRCVFKSNSNYRYKDHRSLNIHDISMRMKRLNTSIIYKNLNKTLEAGSQGATLLVDLDLAFRFSSLFLPQVVTSQL